MSESGARSRFEALVEASSLSPEEKEDWRVFGMALEESDLIPYLELLEEEPNSLARIREGAVLESEYLRTGDAAMLQEVTVDSERALEFLRKSS